MDADLLVLGTGTAGQRAAQICRKAGWQVAMVESFSPGGTCSQFGCDAKKPLAGAAAALRAVEDLAERGVFSGDIRIDWRPLIRFKGSFTDPIAGRTREKLTKLGIELVAGTPRFTGRNSVAVDGRAIRADRTLIATGLMPRILDLPGADLLTASRSFLDLEALPKRIIFVGGGYISFELGHAAAAAGAEVTILQADDRPLVRFDRDMVNVVLAASRKQGMRVLLDMPVETIERKGGELLVSCRDDTFQVKGDLAVHGAGRQPSITGLDLEKGGVEHTEDGIAVNAFLQSISNPAVYAAGDVAATGAPALTPISGREGALAGENILQGNTTRLDHGPVPTTAFTVPAIAGVGLTEQEAEAGGRRFEVRAGDLAGSKLLEQTGGVHAAGKMICDSDEDTLLGAHYVGPFAEEIINLFAFAMRFGIPVKRMKDCVFTYPSFSNLLKGIL